MGVFGVLAVMEQKTSIRHKSEDNWDVPARPRDRIKWDSVERSTPVIFAIEALETWRAKSV
jgi:hypothetical protein